MRIEGFIFVIGLLCDLSHLRMVRSKKAEFFFSLFIEPCDPNVTLASGETVDREPRFSRFVKVYEEVDQDAQVWVLAFRQDRQIVGS